MIVIIIDQLYENYLAYKFYDFWTDKFMIFDTTDQITREMTGCVLNIITLKLY